MLFALVIKWAGFKCLKIWMLFINVWSVTLYPCSFYIIQVIHSKSWRRRYITYHVVEGSLHSLTFGVAGMMQIFGTWHWSKCSCRINTCHTVHISQSATGVELMLEPMTQLATKDRVSSLLSCDREFRWFKHHECKWDHVCTYSWD